MVSGPFPPSYQGKVSRSVQSQVRDHTGVRSGSKVMRVANVKYAVGAT